MTSLAVSPVRDTARGLRLRIGWRVERYQALSLTEPPCPIESPVTYDTV